MRSRRCGANKSASQLSFPHISEDLIKADTFPPTQLPYVTPSTSPHAPPKKKKKKHAASAHTPVRRETVATVLPPEGLTCQRKEETVCVFWRAVSPRTLCNILVTMERLTVASVRLSQANCVTN